MNENERLLQIIARRVLYDSVNRLHIEPPINQQLWATPPVIQWNNLPLISYNDNAVWYVSTHGGFINFNNAHELIEGLRELKEVVVSRDCANTECNICLDGFGDNVYKCPSCSTGFHKECLEKWLDVDQRCPICKDDIKTPNEKTC